MAARLVAVFGGVPLAALVLARFVAFATLLVPFAPIAVLRPIRGMHVRRARLDVGRRAAGEQARHREAADGDDDSTHGTLACIARATRRSLALRASRDDCV